MILRIFVPQEEYIKVKAYHADNGRFAERSFLMSVKSTINNYATFCGVVAAHQMVFLRMQ